MAIVSSTLLVKELGSIIEDANEMLVRKDCIRELISFLENIKLFLEGNSAVGLFSDDTLVSLGESLKPAQQLVNRNKCKRRLYWIICLETLPQEVKDIVKGIKDSLLKMNVPLKNPELQTLVEKLHEEPPDGESQIEKLLEHGNSNSVMIKLAEELGINSERDRQVLSRELRYLKGDITNAENPQRWEKLTELVDDLLDTLACDNSAVLSPRDENAMIPSFGAFECPLTKLVMKDPVVIQSEHTYERQAIEQWFTTCSRSKREPTCPITGMVLTSTDLHSNHVLRKAIEEWYERNVAARIVSVREKLTVQEGVDDALDEILKLAKENPLNKFQLKEAGLIPEIAKIWSMNGAAYFRAKALAVLEKMVSDDVDNQDVVVKEGLLRSTVRSLGSREEEEKANAAKLLYTLTESSDICAKLGTEKGAIIHLVSLTASKTKELADVAEKTLKNLEKVNSNVLEMAEAGMLQPLLTRLCEGSEDSQIEMASFLAKRHLVKSQKKLVAQTASSILLAMLSGTVEAKEASMEVFLVLVQLEENRRLLLKTELLPALLKTMFNFQSSMNSVFLKLKKNAASIVSKLVSAPGDWEHTSVDSEGNTVHSEPVIHNLLGLMMHVKPNWKATLLEVLTGLASSPDVADEVCSHIRSGNGIRLCFESLSEAAEASQRLSSVKLLSAVSGRLGPEIVLELGRGENMERMKRILRGKAKEESAAAAYALGNIPLTSREVSRLGDPETTRFIAESLDEIASSKHRSTTRVMTEMNEGLLGILLHIIKSQTLSPVPNLMTVLVNQFDRQGQLVVKQRAALCVKTLSEKAPGLAKCPQPPPAQCFSCFSPRSGRKLCPVHSGMCDAQQSVCLIECNVLAPLLELLDEEDESVQVAALEALSTLIGDEVNLQGGVEELAKAEGLQKVVDMFSGVQQRGEVQDRGVWMVERFVRVEEYAKSLSVDTKLFKALIEAFKFGSSSTKRLAQDALTSLKQLSGVSAGNRFRKHK